MLRSTPFLVPERMCMCLPRGLVYARTVQFFTETEAMRASIGRVHARLINIDRTFSIEIERADFQVGFAGQVNAFKRVSTIIDRPLNFAVERATFRVGFADRTQNRAPVSRPKSAT